MQFRTREEMLKHIDGQVRFYYELAKRREVLQSIIEHESHLPIEKINEITGKDYPIPEDEPDKEMGVIFTTQPMANIGKDAEIIDEEEVVLSITEQLQPAYEEEIPSPVDGEPTGRAIPQAKVTVTKETQRNGYTPDGNMIKLSNAIYSSTQVLNNEYRQYHSACIQKMISERRQIVAENWNFDFVWDPKPVQRDFSSRIPEKIFALAAIYTFNRILFDRSKDIAQARKDVEHAIGTELDFSTHTPEYYTNVYNKEREEKEAYKQEVIDVQRPFFNEENRFNDVEGLLDAVSRVKRTSKDSPEKEKEKEEPEIAGR